MNRTSLFVLLEAAIATASATSGLPVPYVVEPVAPAVLRPIDPSAVKVEGWLGARIDANERHRLLVVDTEPLLAGYRQKPGAQPWIGEHVGKWLHAATLAWAYSGDEALRRKLDSVAGALIATQEPDGYLGTYVPEKRFGLYDGADWDVWSHKYNLIGLLTYYRYTGNRNALAASQKIGDLLIATFPAKRSILAAGTHMGMAATSVLEPMVLLYRLTGGQRYLDFCHYILRAYEEPGGPDIVRSLLAPDGKVARIANGKAYEMLSNLVGLGELYRVTGDARLLRATENAWADITGNRLYLTGTASIRECFGADHELPNGEGAHLGETCVTVTWIQLNALLLAQTGEVKYANEIERSLYNQLTAAQSPRGDDWCYYTALEGVKHYDSGITCCHSSGPRGLALAPTLAYLEAGDAIYVNTLETSQAQFKVGGEPVQIRQESRFPYDGQSTLTIKASSPARFTLKVRVPAWAAPLCVGEVSSQGGWLTLPEREWRDGDRVTLAFNLGGRVIRGEYTNHARVAYAWGPFILALDEQLNPEYGVYDAAQFIRAFDGRPPTLLRDPNRLILESAMRGEWDVKAHPVRLVPFADAGLEGKPYAVWLRAPQ
ncbi:MAG TPA: beta-L-arabinofuranosidase domain-containing protein [Opitutaceae bacterium]|nr:beta-L-arabinofuranosidase domain-containing protein [Opitutaceae bacterium]